MPRVPEIIDEGADPILSRLFAKERETNGELFNTTKVLAHCPPILEAAKRLYGSFEKSALVAPNLHALVYVRVATINGCPF